jgi:hypothetical protein
MRSSRILFAAVFVALVLPAGCNEEDNPAGNDGNGGEGGGTSTILTDHTDPAALVAAHAEAMSARDLQAYDALLVQPGKGAAGFEFCPKVMDAYDLPWLDGKCWDYETEMTIITHMFDPNYLSPEAEAVQTIDMDLTVLSITQPKDGTYHVDCTATILVMVGPNEGFLADTRFFFDLVPVGDYLRIQRIEEVERQKAAGAEPRAAGESTSWSAIKSLYRSRE